MPDRSDNAAERLDAYLNGESVEHDSDEIAAFADRVMRNGELAREASTEPSREQIDRIRERIFGSVRHERTGGEPVTTHAFSANGSAPAPSMIPMESARHERPTPASPLSILMTAALIVLIAIGSFGVYRGSLDFLPGGADPVPTDAPGIASYLEASPTATAACDGNQWVSVFDGDVPELLADEPHATLDGNTLTWHCGGSSEVLATDVQDAGTTSAPGVVAMALENDTLRLLNLASGAKVEFDAPLMITDDGELDFQSGYQPSGIGSPWLMVPANEGRTDWRVIDQRTMESFLLSDELGETLPQAFTPSFGFMTGTDVAVVTWQAETPMMDTPTVDVTSGDALSLDRAALVLPGSIEKRRWIEAERFRTRTPFDITSTQFFSVSQDGSLLAYTVDVDGNAVIRVEDAVEGTHVVDVPIEDHTHLVTRFILTADGSRLVYSNGESLQVFNVDQGGFDLTVEHNHSGITAFLPTGDPYTVLASYNNSGTTVAPIDVETGEVQDRYRYVPPIWTQVFGDGEPTSNLVRIVSDSIEGTPATIQLVKLSSGEVVLESDPIDAHPIQVASFNTYLRNGGTLAMVPIGYNRAVVMDATTGDTWEVDAPVNDDRIWRFYPTLDGLYISAYPEPSTGTSEVTESWIAPLEPGAEWVPIEGEADVDAPMIEDGTPTG